jgi:hypothetical protein
VSLAAYVATYCGTVLALAGLAYLVFVLRK